MLFANKWEVFQAMKKLNDRIQKMDIENHDDPVEEMGALLYMCRYQMQSLLAVELLRAYGMYGDVLDRIEDEKSRFMLESEWRKHSRLIAAILDEYQEEMHSTENVYDKNLIEIEDSMCDMFYDISEYIRDELK